MCGIAGIIYKDNQEFSESLIMEMISAMDHRGRDAQSIQKIHGVGIIGHRLMKIKSGVSMQPMMNKNWTIIWNGEIYSIDGENFDSESNDSPQLLAAFEKYGIDVVPKLNGMFVIFAYDGSNIYLIRDRFGSKPLYYYEDSKRFAFASEIKPLTKLPFVGIELNKEAAEEWLTLQNYIGDHTLYKGIKILPPATIINLKTSTKRVYWNYEPHPNKELTYTQTKERLRELVLQAFNRQNTSFSGQWLSGGVDSYIISEYMRPYYKFSCVYSEENYDERQNIEKNIGTQYHLRIHQESINRYLSNAIASLEDLRLGPSYSNHGLAELTSKFVRVCYQGTGGDELFMGYKWRYNQENPYSVNNKTGIHINGVAERFKESFQNQRKWDFDVFLQGLLIVGDRYSSAFHYEERCPFLDNDLLEFSLTIPEEWLMGKRILMDAMKVPQYLREYPKRGFTNPDKIYFQNQYLKNHYLEYFNIHPKRENTALMWSLFALDEWIEQNLIL